MVQQEIIISFQYTLELLFNTKGKSFTPAETVFDWDQFS